MTTLTAITQRPATPGPGRDRAAGVRTTRAGLLTAALAAATMLMTLGAPTASANDPNDSWDGKTYGVAAAAVSQYATPVVASRVGDQIAAEECVVISSKRSHYTDGRGRKRSKNYLFHLNCQAGVADGKPGNSMASPLGQKTKKDQDSAKTLQTRLEKDPDTCNKSEDSYSWCVRLCDRTGLCEVPAYSGT